MTSPSDERVCIDCEHVSHLGSECDVPVGYDHLNGDHECGCPGTSDLLAEVDRLTTALARADAQAMKLADGLHIWREQCEKAEADLRVLREGIKALADTWDHDPDEYHVSLVQASMVAGIRALLGRSS